jgi:peptidyl-prolyl cis-trans isomerase D
MISWMQKHRKYLVVTIWISTIAFVGAGFVGWGAYSYNQDKANSVATVGEKEITLDELQTAYSNLYNYYNQMMGGKLTKEAAEKLHLEDIALNQLIQEALLINFAREHGIVALEEEVIAKIQSIEAFQENGHFSKERYFQVLKSIGTEPNKFERNLKKEIIVEKLTKMLKLPATALDNKMLYSSLYMEDNLAAKKISVDPASIKVEEEELKKFWEAHKNDYLSKKSYQLAVIKVISETIEVGDDAVKAYYEDHKEMFRGADDKIASFEESKARVKEKLQKKKAKTEVLKKYLALKNGKISAEENLTLIEGESDIPLDKIRKSSPGSFIKTIELPNGFMTARLLSIEEPQPLSFEKAKELAKKDLVSQKARKTLEEKAKSEVASLKDLKEIGFVTREDSDKLDFLAKNEAAAFLNHLFTTQEKKGYYLLANSAVIYEIKDQRLYNAEQFEKKKEELQKSADVLKENTVRQSLIKRLEKKYKIEKHFKG